MNVNFEKTDNVNATITISFVEDDYKNDVKKQLNELGRTRPMKGFRPGHVPASLLQKAYGHQVLSQLLDRMVSRSLTDYIVNNKIPVLGEPMLDENTRVDLNTQKDFEFKFKLGLAPEFDIKLDKRVKVPYYNIQVTQEMVDHENESYRMRYGKQVPGEVSAEDSLLRGSLAELNDDGTEKEDGIKVEKTILSPRYLKDDDEKAKMVGVKVGDVVTYNPNKAVAGNITELASLLSVDKEQADVKSDFHFTVNEILVNEPAALDQEFFDNVLGKDQAKNEAEYYEKLKELIAAQFKNDSNYRFTIDVENVLLNKVGDLELPDEFLKSYLLTREENSSKEEVEKNYDNTRKQIVWQLIKEKVASQFEVKVESEDLMRLARYMAATQFAQYGMTNLPDDVIDNYAHKMLEDKRYSEDIQNRALDDKLFAAIKEHVGINEKDVTLEEFNKLFEK